MNEDRRPKTEDKKNLSAQRRSPIINNRIVVEESKDEQNG